MLVTTNLNLMLEVNVLSALFLALSYTRYMKIELFSLWKVLTAVAALITFSVNFTHMFAKLRFFLKDTVFLAYFTI